MTVTFTSHYRFPKPDFLQEPWQQQILDTFDAVDSAIFSLASLLGIHTWTNATTFTLDQIAQDSADGSVWLCLVNHTSAASPTTFAADRAAHPTFWSSTVFTTTIGPQGPQGVRGNSILNGNGVPSNVAGQTAGDYYIDNLTHIMYGPLIGANTWGAGTNLIGPSGSGSGDVVHTLTLTAAGLITGGGDLSVNRTFTVTESSLAQAQAGTDHTTAMTPGRVADAIVALAGNVFSTRQVLAGGIATGGGTLAADRTITVTKSTLAQAQAGADDTTAMTPLRVKDAITQFGNVGDVVHTRLVNTSGLATGGGDLASDRTITVTESSLAQAQAGTDHTTVMTPGRVLDAITQFASTAGQLVSVVTYSSSQTITIPATATKGLVFKWGASGGSGGGAASSPTGGTGAAGFLIKYLTGLTPGNTLVYTQGAAGAAGTAAPAVGGNGTASTLASGTQAITTLTANGSNGSAAGTVNGTGTAGGTATNGDINITGASGASALAADQNGVLLAALAGGAPGGSLFAPGALGNNGTAAVGNAGHSGGMFIMWFK